MNRGVGLDFGTTNSALAVADHATGVHVAEFASALGPTPSFRSVLFFGREEGRAAIEQAAGPRAIERYGELEEQRRLMQSLKSFLASRLFTATSVFGRSHSLEDLVAQIVGPLREEAERSLGPVAPPLVVGRPVRFANQDDADDEARALTRLQAALWQAGFPDVVFEFEPVAAAHHYEQSLDDDELVLIADFGGGTSDFSILPVGPGWRNRSRSADDIVGNAGVAVAGDAFDAQIVRHVVADRLGRGSLRNVFLGGTVPMPNWIYRELERWHHLSFLRSRKTMSFLHEALEGAVEPEKLRALIHLIDDDLGLEMYRSVQDTKTELSRQEESVFRFHDDPVSIETTVTRADFESWIAPDLAQIGSCVDELLDATGTQPGEVDRVFMTGGSAFVPAVRRLFEARFGADRLTGGGELISVASGLALRARNLTAADRPRA
jgi:hypothetical chaperone protein